LRVRKLSFLRLITTKAVNGEAPMKYCLSGKLGRLRTLVGRFTCDLLGKRTPENLEKVWRTISPRPLPLAKDWAAITLVGF